MNTKYTPGPWKAEITATRFSVIGADGFPVLRINGGMVPVQADARLIALAPDMLAALKRIDGWHANGVTRADLETIHALISKAEEK